MAVLYGFTTIVVLLLEATEVDVTFIDEFRQTPIDITYKREMFSTPNVLLDFEKHIEWNPQEEALEPGQMLLGLVTRRPTEHLRPAIYRGMNVRQFASEHLELERSSAAKSVSWRATPKFPTLPFGKPG